MAVHFHDGRPVSAISVTRARAVGGISSRDQFALHAAASVSSAVSDGFVSRSTLAMVAHEPRDTAAASFLAVARVAHVGGRDSVARWKRRPSQYAPCACFRRSQVIVATVRRALRAASASRRCSTAVPAQPAGRHPHASREPAYLALRRRMRHAARPRGDPAGVLRPPRTVSTIVPALDDDVEPPARSASTRCRGGAACAMGRARAAGCLRCGSTTSRSASCVLHGAKRTC